MRQARAFIVVVAVGLAGPAVAEASKAPTATQRAQIAQAASAPAKCLTIRVSTISKTYASYTFTPSRMGSKACQKYASNGITVLHRKSGIWRQAWAGSDCSSPGKLGAPKRVWRELTRPYCGA